MNDEVIGNLLSTAYDNATLFRAGRLQVHIPLRAETALKEVLSLAESAKGVMTVLLTSTVYKLIHPEQDIRNHQTSIPHGYAGRSFDTQHITPWLKRMRFPAMAESGWLTRSLEHKQPYNFDYKGAIRPARLKTAFLEAIDFLQHATAHEINNFIIIFVSGLQEIREKNNLNLVIPAGLPIHSIINILHQHFFSKYTFEGAARLPVLAMYAVYMQLVKELGRYKNIQLLSLASHHSADARSFRLGDIDLVDSSNSAFEAIEVKFNRPITVDVIQAAYNKFMGTPIRRYYILSTSPLDSEHMPQFLQIIAEIQHVHGCQVILNGIENSLRYYLRLLEDPGQFLRNYVGLLSNDIDIKYEHRIAWNDVVLRGYNTMRPQ